LKKQVHRRGFGNWLLFVLAAGLVLALLPAWQVLFLRWFDPLTTGTALQRVVEARWQANNPVPPWRIYWLPGDSVPRSFYRLVWASEDQRFFDHEGFDWIEMRRAWEARGEGRGRGASTITMQTARTVFLWQGRSWLRKALEAVYTFWMELLLDKHRIFELYVNAAEMGPGIYGVGAAARFHFDRRPGQLNIREQALLVAILPNPRQADLQNPDRSVLQRQQRILQRAEKSAVPPELRRLGR
jgi:monofunctional biosynthetic peptidoglycan transglycosylase